MLKFKKDGKRIQVTYDGEDCGVLIKLIRDGLWYYDVSDNTSWDAKSLRRIADKLDRLNSEERG